MLILRIRKAEVALGDGRLEEAFQQAIRPDVRAHYRGQRLIGNLVPAFLARGSEHMSAGQPSLALADFESAKQLGGTQPRIMQLKAAAQAALHDESRRRQQQQQQLQAARQQIDLGAFTLGEAICEGVAGADTHVAGIVETAQRHRQNLAGQLERGRAALREQDYETAIVQAEQVALKSAQNAEASAFVAELLREVAAAAREFVSRGRLDQAHTLLTRCQSLSRGHLQFDELHAMLAQCFASSAVVSHLDVQALTQRLKSLRQMVGNAAWLDEAIVHSEAATSAIDALRTGPLSLLRSDRAENRFFFPVTAPMPPDASPHPARGDARGEARPRAGAAAAGGAVADFSTAFRLHVDGAGSFLVVRKVIVTFGPLSRSRPTDIAFQAPADTPRMTLTRAEEDYFLHSEQPVTINDRPTVDRLMRDGDRIALSRRINLRFKIPYAASATAVIDLASGTRSALGNIRRVLLMDDAFVIGPQPTSHIQATQAERSVVVSWRDGKLQVHTQQAGKPPEVAIILEPHRPVTMDGLSLVAVPVVDLQGDDAPV